MKNVALITGASAGFGVEFARQLAGAAATAWCSRRGARTGSRRSPRSLARRGQSRSICRKKSGSAAKLLADLKAAGEEVDILINNAGFGLIGRFAESDDKRERQMIDLNVGTLTDLCRAVAPAMIKRKSGAILNVASTAAFQAGPEHGGLFRDQGLCLVVHRSAARGTEAARRPCFRSLCPGPTRTEFGEVAGFGGNGLFDRTGNRSPERVIGRPRRARQKPCGRRSWSRPISSERSARGSHRDRSFGDIAGAIKY